MAAKSRPPLARVVLKQGREKPLLAGHPWLFSGAVERIDGDSAPGGLCRIVAASGQTLAFGYVNPRSQIIARVTGHDGPLGPEQLRQRLASALALRQRLGLPASLTAGLDGSSPLPATDAFRLVNSEGDFLPGLIVDRYGTGLVVQLLTAGFDRRRGEVSALLQELLAPAFIYERSDVGVRAEEGLPPAAGLLAGERPDPLVAREAGLELLVDVVKGHKTGLYLDQRENRCLAGSLAAGLPVLNAFAYTGGFGVHAAAGGGEPVVSVEISQEGCELARRNLERNGFARAAADVHRADVFHYLRSDREAYGLIILDPPKFARKESEVERAARGYQDVNRLALQRLLPGGFLMTFSCSQAMSLLHFQQTVFVAAREAGREVHVLRRLGAAADHPFHAFHREGEYLKGLLLRCVQ